MRSLLICAVIIAMVSPAVWANPPRSVNLSMTDYGNKVEVVVVHPVTNPKEHYIYKIEISINGKKFTERTFTSQAGDRQVTTLAIPGLKRGDKVAAKAYCNKFGDRKGVLTITR